MLGAITRELPRRHRRSRTSVSGKVDAAAAPERQAEAAEIKTERE